jgi:hypothetical protein
MEAEEAEEVCSAREQEEKVVSEAWELVELVKLVRWAGVSDLVVGLKGISELI